MIHWISTRHINSAKLKSLNLGECARKLFEKKNKQMSPEKDEQESKPMARNF